MSTCKEGGEGARDVSTVAHNGQDQKNKASHSTVCGAPLALLCLRCGPTKDRLINWPR